jgi:hypothetical protein
LALRLRAVLGPARSVAGFGDGVMDGALRFFDANGMKVYKASHQ